MRPNLRFRRVAKLMLMLCAISFSQILDTKEIGPFGVYMGMTYAELRAQIEIEPLSGHKNEYLGETAPISKVEFAAYIYTISPDVGLCRVTAISGAELEVEVWK